MRFTLSQPHPRPSRRRIYLSGRLVLGLWAVLSLSTGCNQVETDRAGTEPSSTRARNVIEPFQWPEDPAHPVLEIQIGGKKSEGVVRIELMPELAPATVNRVIELADQGYYDGTTFHRVIPGFMIQGGDPNTRDRDPTNDGYGDSTIKFQDEFGHAPFSRGVVGMGNSGGPDTTSAQFFIMHKDQPSLVGRYTAVGRVISGLDLVDTITQVPIDQSGRWGPIDRPIENVVMTRVRTLGPIASLQRSEEPTPAKQPPSQAQSTSTPEASNGDAGTMPASPATDWERWEADGR